MNRQPSDLVLFLYIVAILGGVMLAFIATGCASTSHVVLDVRIVQCEPGPVPSERVCR